MRYGKKISAILAAAMVFSSVSCFAAVADTNDAELSESEVVSVAELPEQAEDELNLDEIEEISTEEAETELAADTVTLTVEQTPYGSITLFENSGGEAETADIKSGIVASSIIKDTGFFKLTAPSEVVLKTGAHGVFPDNPEISTSYIEFRNNGTKEVGFEAKSKGKLTIYARVASNKKLTLTGDAGSYISQSVSNIVTTAGSGKDPVGTETFEVEIGVYQLYVDGGTGELFGIKFEPISENSSTKTGTLTTAQGNEVKVEVQAIEGYELDQIFVDGKPIEGNVFIADKDAVVTATYKVDTATTESVNKFFDELNIPTVVPAETASFTLPTVAIENSTVEWTSSNPAVIGEDGSITSPVGADVDVTLTAVVTLPIGATITKEFKITVPGVDLQAEFEKKDFGIQASVEDDFVVDSTFLNQALTWTSSDSAIAFSKEANENGKITAKVSRPLFVDGDKDVTVTVTVANPNGESFSKTYPVKVVKYENSGEHSTANLILSRIELKGDNGETEDITLTSNIDLPTKDATYGGTITWVSSNPKVVTNEGIVKRPSGGDVTVRLTAVVEKDGIKASGEFTVLVKGKRTSGGGGGGYSSSGYGSTYSSNAGGVSANYVDYNALKIDANIKTDETAPVFTDITEYGWAASHINRLVNKGVVKGIGDNKFNPEGLVTREQFATMLVRAFNFTGDTTTAKKFEDVESGAYYEEAIAILSSMGVINGQSETTFGVGQGISRQDMAVMCALATKVDNDAEVGEFNDAADIAGYAVDSVKKMKKCGILSGDENNNFNPRNNATRAEAAKIISVMMDFVETSGAN